MTTLEHPRFGRCLEVIAGPNRVLLSLDFGPRIVLLTTSLASSGTGNLLWVEDIENPAMGGGTRLRAGHRLWTAPETEATWVDDEHDVDVDSDGFLVAPVDGRGVARAFRVRAEGDDVVVEHRLRNDSDVDVEVAAWGVTMFRAHARVQVQLPPFQPWPEAVQASSSLALWPYTRLDDPRLGFGGRTLTVAHKPGLSSSKIGGFLPVPVVRAFIEDGDDDIVIEKQWAGVVGARHADQGCNWEIYVDSSVVEAESLSPLTVLEPGAELRHDERWIISRQPRA